MVSTRLYPSPLITGLDIDCPFVIAETPATFEIASIAFVALVCKSSVLSTVEMT